MNPDHADESDQRDDMPRAVEHALRKHNAMDDELCRTVAGEVWQDMRQAYDDIYGMWREEIRAAMKLERERDRLREELRDMDRLRDALKEIQRAADESDSHSYGTLSTCFVRSWVRAALEGKP